MVNIIDNNGSEGIHEAPTDELKADSEKNNLSDEGFSVLSPRSCLRAAKEAEEEANEAKMAAETEVCSYH